MPDEIPDDLVEVAWKAWLDYSDGAHGRDAMAHALAVVSQAGWMKRDDPRERQLMEDVEVLRWQRDEARTQVKALVKALDQIANVAIHEARDALRAFRDSQEAHHAE